VRNIGGNVSPLVAALSMALVMTVYYCVHKLLWKREPSAIDMIVGTSFCVLIINLGMRLL